MIGFHAAAQPATRHAADLHRPPSTRATPRIVLLAVTLAAITASLAPHAATTAAAADLSEIRVLAEGWDGPAVDTGWPDNWDVAWPQGWQVHSFSSRTPNLSIREGQGTQMGQVGSHSNVHAYLSIEHLIDAAQRVDIRWPRSSGTATNAAGLVARYLPGDERDDDAHRHHAPRTAYRAELDARRGTLRLTRYVDGDSTTIATATVDAGADDGDAEPFHWEYDRWYTLRFEVEQLDEQRTELRAKLWPRGTREPHRWTVTAVDDTPALQHAAGLRGLHANTSGNRRWWFDNYRIGEDDLKIQWVYDGPPKEPVEGDTPLPVDPEPYDVPYIGEVELTGTLGEESWWDRGLPLKFLADSSHRVPELEDLAAEVRLGWNDQGLLVLAKVRDDEPVEYPDEQDLWEADSLELFVSEGLGSRNRYQLAISPGRDPEYREVRYRFYPKAGGRELEHLRVEYAASILNGADDANDANEANDAADEGDNGAEETAQENAEEAEDADAPYDPGEGYVLEILLPWSNLDENWSPLEGDAFAFQIYVNDLDDRDDLEQRSGWQWIGAHPARSASGNPDSMLPFRLADDAGRAVRLRHEVRYDRDAQDLLVELYADRGLVGRDVTLYAADDAIAHATFTERDRVARATLTLPRPPYPKRWAGLEVRIDDEQSRVVYVPDNLSREHAAQLSGTFLGLREEQLEIALDSEDTIVRFPFEELSSGNQRTVLDLHNARARRQPPEWVDGYALRYELRLANDLLDMDAKTVTATIPNGGWLNEWGDDIAVFASDGTEVPVIVLSHAADGDTTIQFRRHQYDNTYWVYASNPDAGPRDFQQFDEDPEELRLAAEEATLKMMAAQREAGELTGELRDITRRVDRERDTRDSAQAELDEWNELLPGRVEDRDAAAEALEKAEADHTAAAEAHEEPARIAEEKTSIARRLTRAARSARSEADSAEQAHAQAERNLTEAREALRRAEQAHEDATERHNAATERLREAERAEESARADARRAAQRAERDDLDANERREAERQRDAAQRRAEQAEQALAQARAGVESAKERLDAAAAELAAAPDRVAEAEAALEQAASAMAEKVAAADAAEAEAEPAEEEAREARLAAAPTANALEEAEGVLRDARSRASRTERLVREARNRIERAEGIRDGAEENLAELMPVLEPLEEKTTDAQQRAREFAALAEEKHQQYYDMAYEADPRLFREGLTVEYRQWEGDKLGDWPVVVDGLGRSETVTDNAIVASVYQKDRLFRGNDPLNFAASYRGYLKVDESGVYSFFVNADDTVFLFINGYLVYSRTGTNRPLSGRVPIFAIGADMQLEEGVHPFEVHHVVGNTRGAEGYAMMMWIPPEEESWSLIPESAFTRSALAVPVAVEARDGEPVAMARWGVDDELTADGVRLYLTRFQAVGEVDPDRLEWRFEDGTTATGASMRHVFFEPGDTMIELASHPDIPPFRRSIHVLREENEPNPHALARTVEALGAMNLEGLTTARLNDAIHFLRISGQANRWPVIEQVARELLDRDGIDIKHRVLAYGSLIHALAHQGRGADAIELIDEAVAAAENVRTLRARAMLEAANMYRDVLRDFAEADELYERIIVENNRLRHPIVREAAVAWGDMYLDAGDRARAGEAYRMARRLGEIGASAAAGDPVQQGALLRVAEQQLQQDDVRQSRRMLTRIEQDFPEQKLEGLYRFLRAEADRHAGDYEQAIRHYEVVMQLSEWASYHPHAMRGIADSYYRMGEFDTALDWYAALESRYTRAFDEHDMGEDVKIVRARLERLEAVQEQIEDEYADANEDVDAEEIASLAGRLFSRSTQNFEPGSNPHDDADTRLTMGFAGPGTFMVRPDAGETALPTMELENLPSQGTLWVEFWYRTRLGDTTAGAHRRYTRVRVYDEAGDRLGEELLYLPRTFGEWRKASFEFDAPRTHDGRVTIHARCGGEILEIDAVEVHHVSDGLNNAMRRFREGADPQ